MKEESLRFIAETWAQRAQAELGAERRFHLLSERLKAENGNQKIIDLVEKAQEEERQHAYLCAKVAREYGHETGFQEIKQASRYLNNRSWVQEESSANQLLCDVVLLCCVTETFNASLMATIYEKTSRDSRIGKIIQTILKDEVKHSQIGWAYLFFESKKKDCGFLSKYLIEMLDVSVRDELFLPFKGNVEGEEVFYYGIIPVKDRLSQFELTLRQVVIPGFQKFNINTNSMEGWLEKKKGHIRAASQAKL